MVRDLLVLGAFFLVFVYLLQVDTGEASRVEDSPPSILRTDSDPPSSAPVREGETSTRSPLAKGENPHSLPLEKVEKEGVNVVRAVHVIDGDTIILADGRQVRYIGVDTPELGDRRLAGAADAAREANRRLVEGNDLRLERDVRELDRYGRLLAYVWVGETLVNEELLREGWARLLTIPPDVRYVGRFREAARVGAAKRLAIWSPPQRDPAGWRGTPSQSGRVAGSATADIDCPLEKPVKGNISRRGEKIYHLPSGDFYERTRPEACFATARDAEAAGYRASRR